MHDYDVGATALSVPPASAVIQPYRPAVLVKNNGVHDALAVGSLRIYSPAGLLIFTTAVYSGVIAPGETQPAQAVDYWTPPALGRYMVIATVSCINDQYEPNNNLAPCFVDVIPGEPTPPTPVAMHAAQHEEGGGDEIIIDGLHGRAADAQTALAHKASHQAGGSDALNVSGLMGILGQGQPYTDHHFSHENNGGDEMNVENLSGELWNKQKPKDHGNEAHAPNMATESVFEAHRDSNYPHPDAIGLEHTANKGDPNGYCPLDGDALVPQDNMPWDAGFVAARGPGWTLPYDYPDSPIATIFIPEAHLSQVMGIEFDVYGNVVVGTFPGQTLNFRLKWGSYEAADMLCNSDFALASNKTYFLHVHAVIHAVSATELSGVLHVSLVDSFNQIIAGLNDQPIAFVAIGDVDAYGIVSAHFSGAGIDTSLVRKAFYAHTMVPKLAPPA